MEKRLGYSNIFFYFIADPTRVSPVGDIYNVYQPVRPSQRALAPVKEVRSESKFNNNYQDEVVRKGDKIFKIPTYQ